MSKKTDFIHADLIDMCTPNCHLSVISWSLLLISRSVVSSLGNPMDFSMTGFPILHHLPELAQTHVHWVSDAIQPSHPLSSPSPPTFNLSKVFSNESALPIRCPKYWRFSFNIGLSNEHPGLISFMILGSQGAQLKIVLLWGKGRLRPSRAVGKDPEARLAQDDGAQRKPCLCKWTNCAPFAAWGMEDWLQNF